MKPDSMDAVFQALAHAGRRRMLDIIRSNPGCGVGAVCERFDMSRIGAMKHLRVLEAARLVLSRKEGRTRRLYVNAAPIQMIHDRWLSEWSALWASEVTQIKYRVETAAGGAPDTTSRRTARATGKKRGRSGKKASPTRGAKKRKGK
jgi:DNA-binding transcriptional ArsR family regulator